MYAGFNTIKPHAVLKSSRAGYEQLPESVHVSPIRIEEKAKSKLSNHRRIQYQNCAIWAKKHNKNGDFFLQQLGHIDEDTLKGVKNKERFSRAILEDIAKRIGH